MDNNDRVPTLAECLEEWKQKKPLLEDIDVLEQERERLTVAIHTLRDTEQALRTSIVQMSHTLSQLYELGKKMAEDRTGTIVHT